MPSIPARELNRVKQPYKDNQRIRDVVFLLLSALLIVLVVLQATTPIATAVPEDWAQGWSDFFQLGYYSPSSGGPTVVVDSSSGTILLFGFEKAARGMDLYVRTTEDFRHFSPPRYLYGSLFSPHDLNAKIDPEGNVHLVWIDHFEDRRGSAVYYSRLDPRSGEVLNRGRVSDIRSGIRSPSLTVDEDSNAHVVWSAPAGDKYVVEYKKITSSGRLSGEGSKTPISPHYRVDFPTIEVDDEHRIMVNWVSRGSLPSVQSVNYGLFTPDLNPIRVNRGVGSFLQQYRLERPFQVIRGPSGDFWYLLSASMPSEGSSSALDISLFKIDSDGEVKQKFVLVDGSSSRILSQPYGVIAEGDVFHLVWLQRSPEQTFGVWYERFQLPSLSNSKPVLISDWEGPTSSAPVVKVVSGNLHVFWLGFGNQGKPNPRLIYRNDLFSKPLSVWRQIGISERNPFVVICYSVVFSLVAVPFSLILPNLHLLLGAWGLVVVVRKYILSPIGCVSGYIPLLIGFSLLFLGFTPLNPLFVNLGLADLAYISPLYQVIQFFLSSLLAVIVLKQLGSKQIEGFELLIAMVVWAFWSGLFLAIPGSVISL